MPATEPEENAGGGGSDGAAAGQGPAPEPDHLGGKRKREGAALWAIAKARAGVVAAFHGAREAALREEARVLQLAHTLSGGDEPETDTARVDELRSFREFAAREEPGLSRVSTAAMGEIWAEAEEEARGSRGQFGQYALGLAAAKRMRAHAAAQVGFGRTVASYYHPSTDVRDSPTHPENRCLCS
jgi:hypothetical protein